MEVAATGTERERELERALAEARRAAERLSGELDLRNDLEPVIVVTREGEVIAADPAEHRWFHSGEAPLLGGSVSALFAPEEAVRVQTLLAEGWFGAGEHPLRLRDGQAVSLQPLRLAGGAEALWMIGLRDITPLALAASSAEQRARLQTIAELAGAMTRELNDPIAVAQGRLELLLELGVRAPEATERHLRVALEHIRRVSATLRNLRILGRPPAFRAERVFVSDLVDAARDLIGPRLRDVTLDSEVSPKDLAVSGDGALLARVLGNIFGDLLDLVPRGGTLSVRARKTSDEVTVNAFAGVASLQEGRNLPKESKEHRFGGGLGVSIARDLARAVGGELERRSSDVAALYTLHLPRAPSPSPRGEGTSILVVGGESLCGLVDALISADGYRIVGAQAVSAALERVASEPELAAVVCEVAVGSASGVAFAQECASRFGRRVRLVLVADAELNPLPGQIAVVARPLRRGALLDALREAPGARRRGG